MQLDLFSTEEPMLSLDELRGALSRHGWDRVGAPTIKGGTTWHEFRRGTSDEFNVAAEGELPIWLAQLDAACATWAGRARKELPRLRVGSALARDDAYRAARAAARHITDVELRREVEQEIAQASRHQATWEGRG